MAAKDLDEASPVVNTNETNPSRREVLVHGRKVVAGIGITALLGDLGVFPGKSYGVDRSTMSCMC